MFKRFIVSRTILFSFLVLSLLVACDSSKKTTATPSKKSKEVSKLKSRIQAKKIVFNTFYGKGKVFYDDGKTSITGSLKLKIENNDKIWLSATKFGFEGARGLITQDSVYFINRLKKSYIKEPISYLEEKFKVPATFGDVQDYLIGNIIYKDNSVFNIEESLITITTLMEDNKLTYTVEPEALNITSLTAIDTKDRTVVSFFSEYEDEPIGSFSKKRKIETNEGGKAIKAEINYSKIDWNQNIDMPFSIPNSYKRVNL